MTDILLFFVIFIVCILLFDSYVLPLIIALFITAVIFGFVSIS